MLHAVFRCTIAVAILCLSSQAHAATTTPSTMVQFAYDQINKDAWAGKSDPAEVSLAPSQLTAKWFTAKFIAALKKNAKCWAAGKQGVGSIWYGGQDHKIANLKIESLGPQKIRAEFTNSAKPQKVEFVFQKAGKGWRIDNVLQNGEDLYAAMIKGCSG
jgi:hypothetical protein